MNLAILLLVLDGMAVRHICFTCFDLSLLDRLARLNYEEDVRYVIAQVERGNETQRLHVQGYIECFAPHRFPWYKRALGDDTIHLERRRGTREEARNYCRKSDSRQWGPYEFGRWQAGGQGRRNDLDGIRQRIREGATPLDVADSDFGAWVRHYQAFDRYSAMAYSSDLRLRDLRVDVLWGPTGTGKTHRAFQVDPTAYRLVPPRSDGSIWWDGYSGQATVIIDDYERWIPYRTLLMYLDKYPIMLPIKGSFTPARYTRVVITSNLEPDMWHPDKEYEPLRRRLHHIHHVTSVNDQVTL